MNTLPKSSRAALLGVSLLLSSLPLAVAQTNTGATTGVYDENAFATNTVDANATTLTASTFGTGVATAFTNNRGGVINFDNTSVNGGTGILTATFGAGQGKTLSIGYADSNLGLYNLQNANTNVAAISGNAGNNIGNYLIPLFPGTNDTPNNFTLTLGTITGGSAGEAVTQMGFTLLGRNGNVATTATVTALFSDSTTSMANRTFTTNGRGTEDTFFGFTAPVGASITSLNISFGIGGGRAIDDLGFITATPAPEPSTYALALGGLGLLLGVQRFRRGRVNP